MADKKKKKMKQKQKQKQSQQVIVNIGNLRQRRPREENNKPVVKAQQAPQPLVQYLYRDNLALNMLNDRTRVAQPAAIPQPVIPQQPVIPPQPVTAPPPRRIFTKQPPNTLPPMPSTNIVKNLVDNHKSYGTSTISSEASNNKKITEFYKALNPDPIIPDPIIPEDTDVEPENMSVRKPYRSGNNVIDNDFKPTSLARPRPSSTLNIPPKLTKNGLPNKRSKDYDFYMENYIGKMPAAYRNEFQQKAYNEFLFYSTPSRSVQPTNSDIIDEEEYIFSPVRIKPT